MRASILTQRFTVAEAQTEVASIRRSELAALAEIMATDDKLYQDVLDALDVGIVLFTERSGQVLMANAAGDAAMAAFSSGRGVVPPAISDGVDVLRPGKAFAPAVRIAAPAGHRYYVRGKELRPGLVLLTITAAGVREADFARLLYRRYHLNRGESRVAYLLRAGVDTQEIASRTGLSLATVRQYVKNVMAATDAHNRAQLLSLFERLLFQEPDDDDRGVDPE